MRALTKNSRKKWFLLSAAIIAEATATLALRATVDQRAWVILVVIAYVLAFTLIGLTLRTGMPIGVVYGIWGACGVALVAVFGTVIFGETLSPLAIAGICIIIVGVVLVEIGSGPTRPTRDESESTV